MFLIFALGIIAFSLSLILTPLVRDLFKERAFIDHPDGFRKQHSVPIPRVGGISIAISYLLALAAALVLPFSYRANVLASVPDAMRLVIAAGVIFITGVIDDLFSLRPWQKLLGQLVGSVIAFYGGVQVDLLSRLPFEVLQNETVSTAVSFLITLVWLIGCANSFNLIDGMDGLAAGVGLFATTTMLLAALIQHNIPMVLVTVPLVGCLVGFLRYNFNPASVFLGDSGSLLIGFLLGCYGAMWSQKSATLLGMTAPLIAVSIPLLDAGLAIIRRFIRHQPIFGGDRGHIHHKLLDRGLTPRRAALVMYGICSVVAVISLLLDALHNSFGGLIIVLFCTAAWVGVQHLGYVEFAMASQMFLKGSFRRIIDTQTRLQAFEQALEKAEGFEGCWAVLVQATHDFNFAGVEMHAAGRDCSYPAGHLSGWQISIPLGDNGQQVVFHRAFELEMDVLVIGSFVNAVRRIVTAKLITSPDPVAVPALDPLVLTGSVAAESK